MINFSFGITNPWHKENFKNIFHAHKSLSKHKHCEFQVTRYSYDLFEITINMSMRGTDHAGLQLSLGLFGYSVGLNIYDVRHWDYENNCWES